MPKSNPLSIEELHALLPRFAATAQLIEDLARKSSGAKRESTAKRSPIGRRPGGKAKAARTRSGTAALQGKLLAALMGSKAGLPLGVIVKKVGANKSAVQYQLRQLRSAKKARVVGDRRAARWFAQK